MCNSTKDVETWVNDTLHVSLAFLVNLVFMVRLPIKSSRTHTTSCPQVRHIERSELKLLKTESLRLESVP